MSPQIDLDPRREAMVRTQIASRGVEDPLVLEALRVVPRDSFVDEAIAGEAYDDSPLPIGAGQTISQPYIVARMIEAAQVHPGDWVLEVGAGPGYAAALLSRIAARVVAVERHAELAEEARNRIARLGYSNIEIRTGDGSGGWARGAPYNAILVSAGGPAVPEPLIEQLAVGGRLVMPVGPAEQQQLIVVLRESARRFKETVLEDVRFVPLIGRHGWVDRESEALIQPAAT